MSKEHGPLEEIGGDWFVNRKDELDLFWRWAMSIPERVHGSYALIGLRRTGKTAILHRLFNRLFHEQEKVIPLYISFARYLKRAEPINAYEFVKEYFSGLVRSYLAFQYRAPELLQQNTEYEDLLDFAQQRADALMLEWFQRYRRNQGDPDDRTRAHTLMQWVINLPKGYAFGRKLPMVIIIDEFQVLTRVYNPDSKLMRDITDSFQSAAETHWAPLLVAGSSVSLMVDNALGGLLSGRFSYCHLQPLAQEYAFDMAFRLGQENGVAVNEALALAIWEITQGYPYAIERLLKSSSPAIHKLPALDALQEVLLYELTQKDGGLWNHYDEEYGKYIRLLNGEGATRKVLLWTVKHPERRIFSDEVAQEVGLHEAKVREVLAKLYQGDIIDRVGTVSYTGPADPMLRRYIEYDHRLEVEKLAPAEAAQELVSEYRRLQGETSRKVGHLAEIIVGGVMNSFDGRTVDGATYFNQPGAIMLPKFTKLERRGGVIKDGAPKEIDIIAEWRTPVTPTTTAQAGVWLVSVRHRERTMGEQEVQAFLQQTAAWLTEKQGEKPSDQVARWYVSKLGFTQSARQLLQTEGVYASNLAQFNQLAQMFGFLPLTV